jgi:hypothetical protein
MRKRALHVFLALGLVLSVFAGTLAVGSAQDNDNDNDLNNDYPNQSYLPWVPNGSTIDDPRDFGTTGPYYGTITVQNLENDEINVSWTAVRTEESGSFTLDPLASTTVTAEGIFGDNDVDGSGVVLTGEEGARIAAVQKQAAPVSPDGNAGTGAAHEIVGGYTGLTVDEIGTNLVLPIVQTNNNWNTLIRLTNFGGSAATVDLTLHEAGGASDPETYELEVRAGGTLTFDLLDRGIPDGWTGSARIESDINVGAVAERVKNETNMLIMNTSQPAEDGQEQYAPLVFQEWFNWNTGISVANLAGNTNDITITYYDRDGNVADEDTFSVPPNGMDFVYTPSTVLNDNDEVDEGFVGSAIISGNQPFRSAVDEVKYFGDLPDVNHAMSYMVEDDAIGLDESLALPLVQKGDMETAFGDTTGIQLFNPTDGNAAVAIWFIDQDGAEALAIPQVVWLGPQEGHTAYTFDFDELPVDFQGSAIIRVLSGDGQVTAASNNVNYEVQFDGSSSFNLVQSGAVGPEPPTDLPFPPPVSFTVEPAEATNEVGTTHEIQVEVEDEGGLPVTGATVAGVVLSGPHGGTAINESTGADGRATLSYEGTAAGTDQILVSVQGIAETQQVTKTWTEAVVEPEFALALAQNVDENVVGTTHTFTATLTENGNPVNVGEDVDVTIERDGADLDQIEGLGINVVANVATITYTGPAEPAVDTINVTVTVNGNVVAGVPTLTKTWVEPSGNSAAD